MIGHERNRAWLGRTTEVLVEAVTPARSHEHGDGADRDAAGTSGPDRSAVRLTGRTREHKLVHLLGPVGLVGCLVSARIEHAGPYALRGTLT